MDGYRVEEADLSGGSREMGLSCLILLASRTTVSVEFIMGTSLKIRTTDENR
ncbi:hypothetical protein MY4824_004445 [Beauveria thailandica]